MLPDPNRSGTKQVPAGVVRGAGFVNRGAVPPPDDAETRTHLRRSLEDFGPSDQTRLGESGAGGWGRPNVERRATARSDHPISYRRTIPSKNGIASRRPSGCRLRSRELFGSASVWKLSESAGFQAHSAPPFPAPTPSTNPAGWMATPQAVPWKLTFGRNNCFV